MADVHKRQVTVGMSAALFYKLKVWSKAYHRTIPSVIREALIFWISQTKPFKTRGCEEFDNEPITVIGVNLPKKEV